MATELAGFHIVNITFQTWATFLWNEYKFSEQWIFTETAQRISNWYLLQVI